MLGTDNLGRDKRIYLRPAYKPHSVYENNVFTGDHLSGTHLSMCLVQPTRNSNGTSSTLFLLGLAPGGGCLAADVTTCAGGLLHHLFTLTVKTATCFCGPVR